MLYRFGSMKWVTVEEYAKVNDISKTAVYKKIKFDKIVHEKRFGRLVVRLNGKKKI